MSVDPRNFRRAMGLFATGVTVITVRVGDTVHGMTANAVTSVSLDPLLILFCVDNRARMAQIIKEAGRFAINVLSERQQALSSHFSGRPVEGLEVDFLETEGVPTLADNLATFVCTLDRIYDGGDHRVIFGRVDALTRATDALSPLLYYAGTYRQLEQQQRERLEALDRIGYAIASSLDVSEIFETFAAQAAQLVPHEAISVTLLSEDGRSLERFALAAATSIAPRAGERQLLDESVAGLVVREGQTIWTNDMASDERFRGENDQRWIAEGFRHFISTPLRARERVIGSLNILKRGDASYDEADVMVAEQIANQIAIFLDNMYQHERIRRQTIAREHPLIQLLTDTLHALDDAERDIHDQELLSVSLQRARSLAQRALSTVESGAS
ncbi:MAG: flavin reductase [Ktedonobacteraceae bacterium]|nr:flavin reductase [Ktedonobacteraceae bacterium]